MLSYHQNNRAGLRSITTQKIPPKNTQTYWKLISSVVEKSDDDKLHAKSVQLSFQGSELDGLITSSLIYLGRTCQQCHKPYYLSVQVLHMTHSHHRPTCTGDILLLKLFLFFLQNNFVYELTFLEHAGLHQNKEDLLFVMMPYYELLHHQ